MKPLFELCAVILVLLTACHPNQETTLVDNMTVINKTQFMNPVLIHTVFFWTKEGTTEEQKKAFEAGLVKLGTCPQIGAFYWGPPAATEKRGVVDNSYDYAINVHFESLEMQAAYQPEPIHMEFIENHQDLWDKVVVYDNQVR